MSIGVLALQGDVAAHAAILRDLGVAVQEVRVPDQLDAVAALIIPGGESTTMSLGIEREGFAAPLRQLAAAGLPIFGTCAGMIMLDRDHLGIADYRCRRNAFGRQSQSFEAGVEMTGVAGGPVRAAFIRAPWVEDYDTAVEVLATVDDHVVAVRQDRLLATAFHPEVVSETRVHELFVQMVRKPAQSGLIAATDA